MRRPLGSREHLCEQNARVCVCARGLSTTRCLHRSLRSALARVEEHAPAVGRKVPGCPPGGAQSAGRPPSPGRRLRPRPQGGAVQGVGPPPGAGDNRNPKAPANRRGTPRSREVLQLAARQAARSPRLRAPGDEREPMRGPPGSRAEARAPAAQPGPPGRPHGPGAARHSKPTSGPPAPAARPPWSPPPGGSPGAAGQSTWRNPPRARPNPINKHVCLSQRRPDLGTRRTPPGDWPNIKAGPDRSRETRVEARSSDAIPWRAATQRGLLLISASWDHKTTVRAAE